MTQKRLGQFIKQLACVVWKAMEIGVRRVGTVWCDVERLGLACVELWWRRGFAAVVLGVGAGGAFAGAAQARGRHGPEVRWPGVERGGAQAGGVDAGGVGGAVAAL